MLCQQRFFNSFQKLKVSTEEDVLVSEFKKVSDCYQTIKADRKKLNSLLSLVEIYEKVLI